MTAAGLIEVNPPSELTFSPAVESRPAVRTPRPSTNLRISNISPAHAIAFRIQTTAPACFVVHPVFGTVHPGCVQEVSVCSRVANYDVWRESFLVQATIVDGRAVVPKDLWGHLAPEKIQGWTLGAGLNTRTFQTAATGHGCCGCVAGILACFTPGPRPKVPVPTQPASTGSSSPTKVAIAEDTDKDHKPSREAAAALARERFLKAQCRGRAFSLQNTQPLRDDTCALQLVQLSPAERLTFAEGSNPSAVLTVKNMSTAIVLFRVQVTKLDSIRVSPVSGSVNVGETQEVKISIRGPIDALNDKILVQAATLRDDMLGNAKDLWSKLSEKDIQAQKLVVAVASNVLAEKPSSSGCASSVVRRTRVEDSTRPEESTNVPCPTWFFPKAQGAAHPRNNMVRLGSCFFSCGGGGAGTDQEQEINLVSEPAAEARQQLENGEVKAQDTDESDEGEDDHVSTEASEASSAVRACRPSDNSSGSLAHRCPGD